ncbi:MAG TPA: thioesterase family protein [Geminicoccus sp.]|uniref:thioesterase family protein n=1 Tax=Geminicoccus sp. TaxID=2024832 RepID=UPI002E308708|nr:thioesterase family protein [Geminicoccus sp.]HEX2528956.1 thioesterase family protein [Geminicoccus sp.]
MQDSPLEPIHRAVVAEEWLDYNGHLNEAYYVLIFSHATDALIDLIGMDDGWRRQNLMTVYTLETHVRYLHEVGTGAAVRVSCRLLELDHKRLRLFHSMLRDDDGTLLATAEMLLVHIDQRGPRSAAWTDPVHARLNELLACRAGEPWPDGAGRSIVLTRPNKGS